MFARLARCSGGILLTFLAGSVGHAQVMGQPRLPSREELGALGLELRWFTQVSLDPARDQVRHLAFDGQNLFAQTSRGLVHAIATEGATKSPSDAQRPELPRLRVIAPGVTAPTIESEDSRGDRTLWIAQVGEPDLTSFAPAFNQRHLFVINGSQLYVLEKERGRRLWRVQLLDPPSAPPAASEEYLYVGFITGQLRAFDLRRRSDAWFARTGDAITVPPLPLGDVVAFASQNGVLEVSAADQHRALFYFQTDYPVSAPLDYFGQWILMASEDHHLYAIHARNGKLLWRRALGNPIILPVVGVAEEVYVTPQEGGLYQLDVQTGRTNWQQSSAAQFLAASPTRVYAFDDAGELLILDRKTGQRLGRLEMRGFRLGVQNRYHDRLYLASLNGLLIRLQESDLREPALHESGPAGAGGP